MKKCVRLTLCLYFLLGAGVAAGSTGVWERHCEACHDGRTILNGRIVPDKEQMKAKFKTLPEFVNACGGSPSCMNIVKHDRKLLEKAGKELGLRETVEK